MTQTDRCTYIENEKSETALMALPDLGKGFERSRTLVTLPLAATQKNVRIDFAKKEWFKLIV